MTKATLALITLAFTVATSDCFAQSADSQAGAPTSEQLERMFEMQSQTMEAMKNSLPTMSNFMRVLGDLSAQEDEANAKHYAAAKSQEATLDQKITQSLEFLENGNFIRAKVTAMSISWTPIGNKRIDEEKSIFFEEIKGELLALVKVKSADAN